MSVGFRVGKIYLLVGHVEVAAYYHRFQTVEAFDVFKKAVFPVHAVWQACQTVLGIWRIDADKKKVGIFECHGTAFMVVDVDAYSVFYRQRFMA